METGSRRLRIIGLAGALLVLCLAAAQADPLPRIPQAKQGLPCGLGGGLALLGSATCLRIGGLVRADAAVTTRGSVASPGIVTVGRPKRAISSALRPEARIDAEARTETPYGPLRAYVSVKAR